MNSESSAKEALRRVALARRRSLSPEQAAAWSREIHRRIWSLKVYRNAKTVHTYVALPGEVETRPLIRSALRTGKRILVPRVAATQLEHVEIVGLDDLRPGTMGIPEPGPDRKPVSNLGMIDLVVVPGLIFDRQGRRLGFGKGFYDRFLSQLDVPTVGLAFEEQLSDVVPAGPDDRRVDLVVTEEAVYRSIGD